MANERTAIEVRLLRLTIIVLPLLAACLLWALPRNHSLSRRLQPTAATTLPTRIGPASAPAETTRGDRASGPMSGVADDLVLLSKLPFSSIPAITASTDPDPAASFRRLIALPPEPPRPPPHVDPRMLRKVVDRGVVAYASATDDAERRKGASLIQIAAMVGYPPARALLARNYPGSAAVRSVVSGNDVVRYALDFFKDPTPPTDDSKRLLFALARHFSLEGELDRFAANLIETIRGDSRPQLAYRIDLLLEILTQVRGACRAIAHLISTTTSLSEQECSVFMADQLRRYVETAAPAGREEEAHSRGLLLLSQAQGGGG
jgi:hypothetical protein